MYLINNCFRILFIKKKETFRQFINLFVDTCFEHSLRCASIFSLHPSRILCVQTELTIHLSNKRKYLVAYTWCARNRSQKEEHDVHATLESKKKIINYYKNNMCIYI